MAAARPRIGLPWGPYGDMRGWLRGLSISLIAALFMAFSGAFTSLDAPFGLRLVYWLVLMVLGYVFGTIVSKFFLGQDHPQGLWWRVVLVSVLIAAPYTAVVALAGMLAFHQSYSWSGLPVLFLSVETVTLAVTALNVLVETRIVITHANAAPPKFLERLPLKLRGAEMWAVEAEDHYLRLHTSKGQDLILLRLADAVAELEGIEGAQVHRSWWVARDAITDAKRGDGRATLTLKDGAEVPVSRTYAGPLREKGWI